MAKVSDMIGVVMKSVEKVGVDQLIFTAEDGRQWQLYHQQDCCESVQIEDINGNLDFLVGVPLLMADESSHSPVQDHASVTYTFYKFGTVKGYVDVRWCGSSNGYYSERVDFEEIKK